MTPLIKLVGIFVTAFVVGLSGAMMPGPLLAVTVSEASRRGAVAGPLLMVGHAVLEALLVAAVARGLAGFLNMPVTIGVVGLIGGAVMCWMGQDMVRSAKSASLRTERTRPSRLHPVAAGILVSLSNPYWTIWWATIGMGYVMMGLRFGTLGITVFFAGHIAADFAWYTFVSVGIAKGGELLPDRTYRAIILVCGVALVAFGVWFLLTGYGALQAHPGSTGSPTPLPPG